jgi:hypothetical protein
MRFAVAILVVALFGAITANKALFKELHEVFFMKSLLKP